MRKFLSILLSFMCVIVIIGCGSTTQTNDKSEKPESTNTVESSNEQNEGQAEEIVDTEEGSEQIADSKESFSEDYKAILSDIEYLNINSEYAVSINLTVWKNKGVDEVDEYLGYLIKDYDTKAYPSLVCAAFGLYSSNGAHVTEAYRYATQYVESLNDINEYSTIIEEEYRDLKTKYGNDYDLADLKEYYIESAAFAEFAQRLEGSYVSYGQRATEFKTDLEKLKKAAEIAY